MYIILNLKPCINIYILCLYGLQLPMKSFIQSFAILITAAFIFGCPPKHDEPLSSNLLGTSKSEHLVIGYPSGAVDSVSSADLFLRAV